MIRIGRVLFYVLAPAMLASCFFAGSGDESQSRVNPILQFQSDREDLALPSLQVGQHVYSDVTLRLAQDGTWQLKSIGPMRRMALGESAQAVLTEPGDAILDMNWQPADATITIRRMHIDAKVFGNIPLRLTGNNWFWGNALQAGNDMQDVQELKALTLADYRANPALVATDTHHTVLHSTPSNRTQSFPLQLEAKRYKFCMDRQDEGADSIRLLDPAGNAVVRLKAGDACIEINLAAGRYTAEHQYGGSGATRTVFIRPTAAPGQSAASLGALSADGLASPEYWAVYVSATANHSDGFLSFNEIYPQESICKGLVDAAAQLRPYSRSGDPATYNLFHGKNFFLIVRDGDGTPRFSFPYYCQQAGFSDWHFFTNSSSAPLLISPSSYSLPDWLDSLLLKQFSGIYFKLGYVYYCGVYPDDCWAESDFGFGSGTLMPALTEGYLSKVTDNFWSVPYNGLSSGPSDTFQIGFRYFPNGLAPSKRDSSGTWLLEQGEVALFSNTGCTGAVMIARHTGVLSPQPAKGSVGSFSGSLQLGPNAVAKISRNGASREVSQSGCLNNHIDLTQESLEIRTTTQIDIHTNSCEYCNLAGIDLSNQTTALKGVKLQHTNLTDGNFANSDLTQADLRNATLQGANLSYTNLETANLCQAFLNGRALPSGTSGSAAQLTGAHLKNANLSGANLDGASFSNASFYSSAQQACQPSDCSSYALPVCASAYKASMNNTRFNNAYLAGVDMGSAAANNANFSHAILFGASFNNATMNSISSTSSPTDFSYAFLQGTDFTNAKIQGAIFTNAYADTDSSNNCMQVLLQNEFTVFPGFKSGAAKSCVTVAQTTPTCIQYTYGKASLPTTNNSNACPDGSLGPCSTTARWTPKTSLANSSQKNSICAAATPLCDGFTQPLNTCW